MRLAVGATVALFAMNPLTSEAQTITPVGGCSGFGTGVRTVGGGVVGAWVGFVLSKIKTSDWSTAAHTSAAIRQRNQFTIGGAVLGAVAANLAFRHPCNFQRGQYAGVARDRSVRRDITQDEINHSGVSGSAYDLVYTLRRQWLNERGIQNLNEAPHYETDANGQEHLVGGEPQLIIYLDEMKMGTISQLRTIPVASVIGVRYYDPAQANFKWGAGHAHGAIQVMTVIDPTMSSRPQSPVMVAPFPERR